MLLYLEWIPSIEKIRWMGPALSLLDGIWLRSFSWRFLLRSKKITQTSVRVRVLPETVGIFSDFRESVQKTWASKRRIPHLHFVALETQSEADLFQVSIRWKKIVTNYQIAREQFLGSLDENRSRFPSEKRRERIHEVPTQMSSGRQYTILGLRAILKSLLRVYMDKSRFLYSDIPSLRCRTQNLPRNLPWARLLSYEKKKFHVSFPSSDLNRNFRKNVTQFTPNTEFKMILTEGRSLDFFPGREATWFFHRFEEAWPPWPL